MTYCLCKSNRYSQKGNLLPQEVCIVARFGKYRYAPVHRLHFSEIHDVKDRYVQYGEIGLLFFRLVPQ